MLPPRTSGSGCSTSGTLPEPVTSTVSSPASAPSQRNATARSNAPTARVAAIGPATGRTSSLTAPAVRSVPPTAARAAGSVVRPAVRAVRR